MQLTALAVSAYSILVGSWEVLLDVLFILLRLISFEYVRICGDKEKVRQILYTIKQTSVSSSLYYFQGHVRPNGLCIGWRYVAYITTDAFGSPIIQLFGRKSFILNVLNNNQSQFDKAEADAGEGRGEGPAETEPAKGEAAGKPTALCIKKKMIHIWNRTGSYTNGLYYKQMQFPTDHLHPIGQQIEIVKTILAAYKKTQSLTVFISGVTGAGKSMIGLLVAKELNANYCHTFNPTEPSDTLSSALYEMNTEVQTPSILVLEEVNSLLRAIHNETIPKHKNVPISVYNKITWNSFLDDMMLYRKVILILTSNEERAALDELDPSYLRKGRVNLYFHMPKVHEMVEMVEAQTNG